MRATIVAVIAAAAALAVYFVGLTPIDKRLTSLLRNHSSLVDPGSAEFRNLTVMDLAGETTWCGELNAKNRMGGFVGWTPFAIREATGNVLVDIPSDSDDDSPRARVLRELKPLRVEIACADRRLEPAPRREWLPPWGK